MFRDYSSALFVVLVIVVGGLAYLLLPGRLNGPASNQSATSTVASTTNGLIVPTTTPNN